MCRCLGLCKVAPEVPFIQFIRLHAFIAYRDFIFKIVFLSGQSILAIC